MSSTDGVSMAISVSAFSGSQGTGAASDGTVASEMRERDPPGAVLLLRGLTNDAT